MAHGSGGGFRVKTPVLEVAFLERESVKHWEIKHVDLMSKRCFFF